MSAQIMDGGIAGLSAKQLGARELSEYSNASSQRRQNLWSAHVRQNRNREIHEDASKKEKGSTDDRGLQNTECRRSQKTKQRGHQVHGFHREAHNAPTSAKTEAINA